jgi:hypothetical protein
MLIRPCVSLWTGMGGVKYDLRPVCISDIKFPWCGGQRQSFTIWGCWFNTHGGEMLHRFFFSPARVPVTGEGAGSNLHVGKY